MSATNCGGPAFPPGPDMKMRDCPAFPGRLYESREWWTGISTRLYLAGRIAAALTDPLAPTSDAAVLALARKAFKVADALIVVEGEGR